MSGLRDDYWDDFWAGIAELEKINLFISDSPVMNTMAVRADVAKMKALHGIEWIALDYLGLLTDTGADDNAVAELKGKRFRQICREFDVAGLTIQSMNKEGMKALIPHLADMSGPSGLAYLADVVFFMIPDPDISNIFKLLPAKQRDGDQGNAPIDLVRPQGRLGFECLEKDELP